MPSFGARALATTPNGPKSAEQHRLDLDALREENWKRWGPYLSERQWGTVREDYSGTGECWSYFPHDHARSRTYRWGEDGLLGICDREGRLCFALALWNGRDPILKERLFGLSGPEGNHGEDVKECYFFLDSTPTHSYMKALYKYPHAEFPYARLREENARRSKTETEFELEDTGIFAEHRYFDVFVEYAKAGPDDLLIRITAANRGPEAALLHILPTLWFRNTWSWGRTGEGYWARPSISRSSPEAMLAEHESLGAFRLEMDSGGGDPPLPVFTNNESNSKRLYGVDSPTPYVKDAFHEFVVAGRAEAVNPAGKGTKAAFHSAREIPAGGQVQLRLRLCQNGLPRTDFGKPFEELFAQRMREADEFYAGQYPSGMTPQESGVVRQAAAGLLWSRQFYHYIVKDWLEGDPSQPAPPPGHAQSRNQEWMQLYNRDVLSMPDTWEYPWFAAWDLAFHMIPFAHLDAAFAKEQLLLFLREWYMRPNGQIPAYEFAFSDVNPPVHAWACWRVYKMTGPRGARDAYFLERAFQKLLINFTWWVNRKDLEGNNLFSGGFLGLDNIGVFDRSKPLPTGGHLEQADGTAWMAFYCSTMLSMALELAADQPAYEDLASKFFEHFVAISDAMNSFGGTGLWDEEDGFYYDQLHAGDTHTPLRIRSMVGLIPLFACENIRQEVLDRLPGFRKRMDWFLKNRKDLAESISYMESGSKAEQEHRLLAIPSKERLLRVLRYVLDEEEFLSPYGIRSLSKRHRSHPYVLEAGGQQYKVEYSPGESDSGLFGGNSNWRGPVWFPLNFLLLEALERYHFFYGDSLKVECPVGSGRMLNLSQVAQEIGRRLAALFLPDASGRRPCHGGIEAYADDPHWKDLVLFHEYFHGEDGRGLGASHQTGWTALVIPALTELVRRRAGGATK